MGHLPHTDDRHIHQISWWRPYWTCANRTPNRQPKKQVCNIMKKYKKKNNSWTINDKHWERTSSNATAFDKYIASITFTRTAQLDVFGASPNGWMFFSSSFILLYSWARMKRATWNERPFGVRAIVELATTTVCLCTSTWHLRRRINRKVKTNGRRTTADGWLFGCLVAWFWRLRLRGGIGAVGVCGVRDRVWCTRLFGRKKQGSPIEW